MTFLRPVRRQRLQSGPPPRDLEGKAETEEPTCDPVAWTHAPSRPPVGTPRGDEEVLAASVGQRHRESVLGAQHSPHGGLFGGRSEEGPGSSRRGRGRWCKDAQSFPQAQGHPPGRGCAACASPAASHAGEGGLSQPAPQASRCTSAESQISSRQGPASGRSLGTHGRSQPRLQVQEKLTFSWMVAPPCRAPGVTGERLGEPRVTGEPATKTLGDRGLCRLQPDPSLG